MSYVDKSLMAGEAVIKRASVHWFIFMPTLCVFVLAFIFLVDNPANKELVFLVCLIGAFLGLKAALHRKCTEFAVTNRRVIAKYGIISRQTMEMNLSKVESLNVDQGIFGRIFNFGQITVNGVGGGRTPFLYIDKPLALRQVVNEQLERAGG